MQPLLDLGLRFASPSPESPLGVIADLEIRCDVLGLTFGGEIFTDPLTEQDREALQWYLEEYWKWPFEGFAERGKKIEQLLYELGKRLYASVFGSDVAQKILQQWQQQQNVHHQISVVSDIAKVLSLPWELLCDSQGFLVLHSDLPVSILRKLPADERVTSPIPYEPPLRILLVTSRPDDAGFIDPRMIARELVDEVQVHVDAGVIELEFLRPPTVSALRARLQDPELPPIHILHFDGHGAFSEQDGQGMLSFEDGEGGRDPITASDMAWVLQNSGVRLVVLTACQSARSATDDAFSSIAAQLIQGGVDAVVAMSASILTTAAAHYAETFYRSLVSGVTAMEAHERAQQVLHADPHRRTSSRALRESGAFVELQDWWLPHFYQQHPLTMQVPLTTFIPEQKSLTPLINRLSDDIPAAPRYGFSGRSRELQHIERSLQNNKVVVLYGFGGIGKTMLAREAADWLTQTRMYAGAIFISFEHGENTTALLSMLGRYLNIYDGHYNPNDLEAALESLRVSLKKQHVLVIIDSLESTLLGEKRLLSNKDESEKQLLQVIIQLKDMGAGILVTSRTKNLGTAWAQLGKQNQIAYIPLFGLKADDAYELATNLLNTLEIDRTKVPYAALMSLLQQLDYHPLSIQLVLPLLKEQTIENIQDDFAKQLSDFVDPQETGRNRSLQASLDYSLRRLSEDQQVLLRRLAPFEGGAAEKELLAITQIPEEAWKDLRSRLGEVGLLAVERMRHAVGVLMLRFHPVLVPFLRSQADTEDEVLLLRYALHYCSLARFLRGEDSKETQAVRDVARREFPNLKRALDRLLEMGRIEIASGIADILAYFLMIAGRQNERDILLQSVVTSRSLSHTSKQSILTQGEYQRETSVGEYEFDIGNIKAAYGRFMALLRRIESQPQEARLRPGSWEHYITLIYLSRCIRDSGNLSAARERMQEALTIILAIIKQEPDNQNLVHQYGLMLTEMGHILVKQAQYTQAQEILEEGLHYAQEQDDLRAQAVALAILGFLKLSQREYAEAKTQYTRAQKLFKTLSEPDGEASTWFQLGRIAQEQEAWKEAERSFREAIVTAESIGNEELIAKTCSELGQVTASLRNFSEAEGWIRRAIAIDERLDPRGFAYTNDLGNLIIILLDSVDEGYFPRARLGELRDEATRLLALYEAKEVRDASEPIWQPLEALGTIALMEGHAELAQDCSKRANLSFAAFAGNREKVDGRFGMLIALIAASAVGSTFARDELAKFENVERQQHFASAIQRIWAGEREWHHLAYGLNLEDALIILRALEVLVMPMRIEPTDAGVRNSMLQLLLVSLPETVQKLVLQGAGAELTRAKTIEGLSPEEYREVGSSLETLNYYLKIHNREQIEERDPAEIVKVVKRFEPLLRTIALVATGDTKHKEFIEPELLELEREEGWQLRAIANHIWSGERDITKLTVSMFLDDYHLALVQRILEFVNFLTEIDEIILSLPLPVQKAIELNNSYAFKQAFDTLDRTVSDEELQTVLEKVDRLNALLASIQIKQYEDEEDFEGREDVIEEEKPPEDTDLPKQLDSALWNLAIAILGDRFDQGEIEDTIAKLEERVPARAVAIRRIWKGERDAGILTVGLSEDDARFVKDLLAVIATIEALPAALRQAVEQQDIVALLRVFESLPVEEQKLVLPVIRFMQISPEQAEEMFEPVLRMIAMVATGNDGNRIQTESILADLELRGFHLTELVYRIWAGERDITDLTASIEDPLQDKLARRLLEIIDDLTAVQKSQDSKVSYQKASELLKRDLDHAVRAEDARDQAVALFQLGALALLQHEYDEALFYLHSARDLFHTLGELAAEAAALSNLGRLAEDQEKWAVAEDYYVESFKLFKKSGDVENTVEMCCTLGTFMLNSDQPAQAEYWLKQALEFEMQDDVKRAKTLYDLAALLTQQVQQNSASHERLAEARIYAEQALKLQETLDDSSESWLTFHILAVIAGMEGQAELAREYRHREREAYAAFEGHRTLIEKESGPSITLFAAAANSEKRMRTAVEEALKAAPNKPLADALQRILMGEREWNSLTEELEAKDALFVLRVLENINLPASSHTPLNEQLLSYVSRGARQAWEDGNIGSFEQAFAQLPPEEQQRLESTKTYLLAELQQVDLVRQCEPLLLIIAEASNGNQDRQVVLELLSRLEEKGYHIQAPVQQIWAGERNREILTDSLDSTNAALVNRLLELIALLTALYAMTREQIIASLPVAARTLLLEQSGAFTIEQALESVSPAERAYTELALHVLGALQEKEDDRELEQALSTLPTGIRIAWEQKDMDALDRVFAGLSPDEQQVVDKQLQTLRALQGERLEKEAREVFSSLPAVIQLALQQDDAEMFDRALTGLPIEEQKRVAKMTQYLQRIGEWMGLGEREQVEYPEEVPTHTDAIEPVFRDNSGGVEQGETAVGEGEPQKDETYPQESETSSTEERDDRPETSEAVLQFEPLLQSIVAVANGDIAQRSRTEVQLEGLEQNGWRLKEVVQRFWSGERNIATLTAGLDEQHASLMRRIVELRIEQKVAAIYQAVLEGAGQETLDNAFNSFTPDEYEMALHAFRSLLPSFEASLEQREVGIEAIKPVESIAHSPDKADGSAQEGSASDDLLEKDDGDGTHERVVECLTAAAGLGGACLGFTHKSAVELLRGEDIDREACQKYLATYKELAVQASILHIESLVQEPMLDAIVRFLQVASTDELEEANRYIAEMPELDDFPLPRWLSEAVIAKRQVAQNAGPEEYFALACKLYAFSHYAESDEDKVIALQNIVVLLNKALTLFAGQGNVPGRIAPAILLVALVYELASAFNIRDDVEQAFYWGEDVLLACVPPPPETESSLQALTTNLLTLCSITAQYTPLDWFYQK